MQALDSVMTFSIAMTGQHKANKAVVRSFANADLDGSYACSNASSASRTMPH